MYLIQLLHYANGQSCRMSAHGYPPHLNRPQADAMSWTVSHKVQNMCHAQAVSHLPSGLLPITYLTGVQESGSLTEYLMYFHPKKLNMKNCYIHIHIYGVKRSLIFTKNNEYHINHIYVPCNNVFRNICSIALIERLLSPSMKQAWT